MFHNIRLDLDDEVYIYEIDLKGHMVHYQLYEAYKIIDLSAPIINHVGSWPSSLSLNLVKEDKNDRRANLRVSVQKIIYEINQSLILIIQGITLSVTSQHNMPYVSLMKNGDGELQLHNGKFVEVFKELSDRLNFSYTVINPPDGEWGVLKEDGTWSGMVGQLETKKVDLAVTDFTITEQRNRVMTFSTPLDEIYHAIIIQNPVNTYHFEAYTSPLTNLTWLILLAWIIATPPILFIVARCIIYKSMLCATTK